MYWNGKPKVCDVGCCQLRQSQELTVRVPFRENRTHCCCVHTSARRKSPLQVWRLASSIWPACAYKESFPSRTSVSPSLTTAAEHLLLMVGGTVCVPPSAIDFSAAVQSLQFAV